MKLTRIKHLLMLQMLFITALGLSTIMAAGKQSKQSRAERAEADFIKRIKKASPASYEDLLEGAINYGYLKALQLLIDKRVDVNFTKGKDKTTPLHMAARKKHSYQCIEMLCNAGADVNALELQPTGRKYTPLMVAALKNDGDNVRALLRAGADPQDAKIFDVSNPGRALIEYCAKELHDEKQRAIWRQENVMTTDDDDDEKEESQDIGKQTEEEKELTAALRLEKQRE